MSNVARFALHFAQGLSTPREAQIIVTFHTMRASVLPQYEPADLYELCEQFVRWWDNGDRTGAGELNGLRLCYSEQTRLVDIVGERIEPTRGDPVTYTFGLPIGGASSDGPGPPQCAVLFSYLTDLESRRGRGRTYMPCVRSGAYDASGQLQTISNAVTNEPPHRTVARWGRVLYRNIAHSGGPTPNDRICVYSRLDSEPRLPVLVRAPQYLATQRRRRIDTIEYEGLDFAAAS